jgi:segregation and condensation protein B
MDELTSKLEALLFVSNKPLTAKELAKFIGSSEADVTTALQSMVEQRKSNGIVLLEASGTYQLATNSAHAELIKNFLNADLREALTDATVEVLAIIAYRQPISKSEIEAIRGVNSQYSLRALLMRGLVEKIPNPHDARGFLYQVTTEFMQHLGLISINDLPEFEKIAPSIKLPETPALKENE